MSPPKAATGPAGRRHTAAILGCSGPRLTPDEAAFFREADPWGFILFARNVDTPAQLRRLTTDLREAVGRDAAVLTDQEGGRVQRLRAPHWREWPPPLDQSLRLAGPDLERGFWLRYRLIASELAAVGIDTCCAPSGDIAGPATHPFLRNRCLGSDPQAIVRAARASAAGLLAGGVLPVTKHMPGHGRAAEDSHHEPPRVAAPADELRQTDFAVFAALADLPFGMTGHVVIDAIDPSRAATVSPAVISFIRGEIGFGGLLSTDDLSMEALGGSIGDRAAAAIAAGCDLALHCNGKRPEMEVVVSAAGPMTDAAVTWASRALGLRGRAEPIDPEALDVEFQALMMTRADG
ncbi:MAG: glycoside hydrolase family 3 N-terminal domain-containing protein [Paracoccaceae bacterium]